jgi:predicted DNA-binding ribbon-helix-helix protein
VLLGTPDTCKVACCAAINAECAQPNHRDSSYAAPAKAAAPSGYLHSPVVKHSVSLAGNKTSITLEKQFWDGLREIARKENISIATLIERIDTDRIGGNLSSSARLFVLSYFKALSRLAPSHTTPDVSADAPLPTP